MNRAACLFASLAIAFVLVFSMAGIVLCAGEPGVLDLQDPARQIDAKYANCASLSPDGDLLAIGYAASEGYGAIEVRSIKTGAIIFNAIGHDGDVHAIVFSRDGKSVATCGHDQTVQLWDVSRRECTNVTRLTDDRAPVALAFSRDKSLLAIGLPSSKVAVLDTRTAKIIKELVPQRTTEVGYYNVCFSPDGKFLAAGGYGPDVRVWTTSTWKDAAALPGFSAGNPAVAVEFSSDNKLLMTAAADNKAVTLYATDSFRAIKTITASHRIGDARLTDDGQWVVLSDYERAIHILDLRTGEVNKTIGRDAKLRSAYGGLSLSRRGDLLVAGAAEGIWLWRAPQKRSNE